MGQYYSTNSNQKHKCVLCNDIIHNNYVSCGECKSDFHKCCYESSLNEYGESNRNAKLTTCPNEFYRGIGVCYTNSYTNSLNHPVHSIHTVQWIPQWIPLAQSKIIV